MKRIILNIGLFLGLALIISNQAGCTGTSASQNGPAETGASTTQAAVNPNAPGGSAAGAPISEKLAQGEFKNLDGSTFSIAGRDGKVLLINMWATWCGPCRSEMPELVKMQDAHREQGFEVIGLNVDNEEVDAINEFASEMNLNYTLAWADMDLQTELLNITQFPGIPQSFIIDRHGRLRAIFKGAAKGDVQKMGEIVSQIVSE